MIRGLVIREAETRDHAAIAALLAAAFGQDDEADLAETLRADGDAVLELVATSQGELVGHVMFSRLTIETEAGRAPAVALAPIAVRPERQRSGIGVALAEHALDVLRQQGERLCVVLGDPAYYSRFGFAHDRARQFMSDYQCQALQALAWGEAPTTGRLVYPRAFSGL